MPHKPTVLVVGGSGYFGKLLVQELLEHTQAHVILAGRDHRRLIMSCADFGAMHQPRLKSAVLDLRSTTSTQSVLAGVDLAICAAGPYQELPLTLVSCCLENKIHYIDLCDDRRFVLDVHHLVQQHSGQTNLPAICTGWSAVPALSGILTNIAVTDMDRIESIDIHIAPGNRSPRSIGTVSSLLLSLGKQFTVYRDGAWQTVEGWSEPRSFQFPAPIGSREGYLVDVPDVEMFPALFGAKRVEFRVGSELALLNRLVSMLAWFSRRKMLPQGKAATSLLRQGMALLGFLGHDWGAVGVQVRGSSGGSVVERQVSIVADRMGQRIPLMPAVIVAKRLLSNQRAFRGIVPVHQWLTREELEIECRMRGYRSVFEGMC